MKMKIKTENIKFTIILPTALFLNRLTAFITSRVLKSKYPSYYVSTKDCFELFKTIKKCKKSRKNMDLLNVSTVDGDNIYISL